MADKLTYVISPMELRQQYMGGFSTRDLAVKYGCNRQHVANLLQRYGVTLRKPGCGSWDQRERKYHFDESVFERCDSPEKAYWLGFLMADGAIHKTTRGTWSLTLGLQEKDYEHVKKFKEYFSFPQSITRISQTLNGKQFNKYSIRICSHKLVGDLGRYGIIERKSGKEEIINIPINLIHDFIRGYFDGDGCARKDGKNTYLNFTSASRKILEQIGWHIGQAIGRTARTINKHGRITWRIEYGGNIQTQLISSYLYDGANTFLPRKRDILNA